MAQAQQDTLSGAVRSDDHRPRPGVEGERNAANDAVRADLEHDVLEPQRQQRMGRAHVHGGHP